MKLYVFTVKLHPDEPYYTNDPKELEEAGLTFGVGITTDLKEKDLIRILSQENLPHILKFFTQDSNFAALGKYKPEHEDSLRKVMIAAGYLEADNKDNPFIKDYIKALEAEGYVITKSETESEDTDGGEAEQDENDKRGEVRDMDEGSGDSDVEEKNKGRDDLNDNDSEIKEGSEEEIKEDPGKIEMVKVDDLDRGDLVAHAKLNKINANQKSNIIKEELRKINGYE